MKKSFQFYLANKMKGVSIIAVMAVSVFVIYFMISLVQSIFSNVEYSNMACLQNLSFVYSTGNNSWLDEDVVAKIETNEKIDKAYHVYLDTTVIKNIFGTTSGYIAFCESGDIDSIFQKIGLNLISGRMPKNDEYEIIMHEDMLKNKGLSVGDTFGKDVDDTEYIRGKYTIVGSFSGPTYMAFGTKNNNVNELVELGANTSNLTFALLTIPKSDLNEMNNFLDNISKESVFSMTLTYGQKQFAENISNIRFLMTVLVVVVALCISAAICTILSTIFNARLPEYSILHAIGYKIQWIRYSMVNEILLLILISWILGMLASFIVIEIIKSLIFEPMGAPLSVFSVSGIAYTFLALIIYSAITIITSSLKLSKIDIISVIEKG